MDTARKTPVLNAFRHLRSIHDRLAEDWAEKYGCSTPFGISDPFTAMGYGQEEFLKMCSTPFGISDPFTSGATIYAFSTTSAQRLSASQIHSHQQSGEHERHGDKCSTPFGISDPFTPH